MPSVLQAASDIAYTVTSTLIAYAERVLSLSGPLTAHVLIVCILGYELDLTVLITDSRVANLSVQKRVPPRLDCRDEDEAEDADHE